MTKPLKDILMHCGKYSMTTPLRLQFMYDKCQEVVKKGIEGSIVECGVWQGGSLMAACYALNNIDSHYTQILGYDTFNGIPEPEEIDINNKGQKASDYWNENYMKSDYNQVLENLYNTGYRKKNIRLIKGDILQTIPQYAPQKISILRLDVDWYKGYKHALRHLYPKLSIGGYLIIDDFEYWQGCKEAFNEYFKGQDIDIIEIDAESIAIQKKGVA